MCRSYLCGGLTWQGRESLVCRRSATHK
jgi:hypothetical protein